MRARWLKACRAGVWCLFFGSTVCIAGPAKPDAKVSAARVSLNFRDAPIQEVFDVLSRKDRINIILGKGVTGNVSVNLYDVTVDAAIRQVAEAGGYAVEYRNGDYVIADRKDAGSEHPAGYVQLRNFRVQYSDPKQIAEILTKYVSRIGKVTPLISRRMIIVEDLPDYLDRAGKLLEQLDIQPKQVLIEAKVLEVTLDQGEIFGVDWTKVFGDPARTSGTIGVNALASGNAVTGPKRAGFFFGLVNKNLELFLEAQASKNRVRTISSPKLLALENQEAKTVIGKSTGYKVTTTINQVTTESIQFLESGVILKVTPSVDQQGRVLLKVHPEVSSTTLNAGIPEKKSTEVTTEFLCEDGQSVFIGGLLKTISSEDKVGVPVLGDIPLVGRLFSTVTEGINVTETVVIITPRIVQDVRDASALSQKSIEQVERSTDLIMEHRLKLDPSVFKEERDLTSHD